MCSGDVSNLIRKGTHAENKQACRSSIFTIIYKHKLVGVRLLRKTVFSLLGRQNEEVDKKGILEKLFLNWNMKNNFPYPGHKHAFLSVKYTHIWVHIHTYTVYVYTHTYIFTIYKYYNAYMFCVYMYNKRYPYVFLKYTYITCTFTMTGLTELL